MGVVADVKCFGHIAQHAAGFRTGKNAVSVYCKAVYYVLANPLEVVGQGVVDVESVKG